MCGCEGIREPLCYRNFATISLCVIVEAPHNPIVISHLDCLALYFPQCIVIRAKYMKINGTHQQQQKGDVMAITPKILATMTAKFIGTMFGMPTSVCVCWCSRYRRPDKYAMENPVQGCSISKVCVRVGITALLDSNFGKGFHYVYRIWFTLYMYMFFFYILSFSPTGYMVHKLRLMPTHLVSTGI